MACGGRVSGGCCCRRRCRRRALAARWIGVARRERAVVRPARRLARPATSTGRHRPPTAAALGLFAERGVDVDQGRLLAFGQHRVAADGGDDFRGFVGLQDARLGEQGFDRDRQPVSDLREDVRARPAQTAFDLGQVRIGNAGLGGQPADRDLRGRPLFPDELAQVADRGQTTGFRSNADDSLPSDRSRRSHAALDETSALRAACNCKHRVSADDAVTKVTGAGTAGCERLGRPRLPRPDSPADRGSRRVVVGDDDRGASRPVDPRSDTDRTPPATTDDRRAANEPGWTAKPGRARRHPAATRPLAGTGHRAAGPS